MKENITAIGYPLPEDIEKLKWYGDFEGAIGLIEKRLGEDIPETLKEKLRMEKRQIIRMERCYTLSEEEAQQFLKENLVSYDPRELVQWRQDGLVDWIFKQGRIYYIRSFYDNLRKIRPDIRERQIGGNEPNRDKELRYGAIRLMRQHGGANIRMKIRAQMNLSQELAKQDCEIKVYLPLPLEKLQSKKVKLEFASNEIKLASKADFPQRTVLLQGKAGELDGCHIVYTVENQVPYVEPKAENVSQEQPDFCLEEQLPHIAFTPYLRALTAEIIGEETNPLLKARKIYDFITTKVNYSYMRSYAALPVIPEYCASRLRGDCGVQALTFITMCRIAGVPAQWQSGLYANDLEAGSHDWAMFYVAPYGWLWADCSFGGDAWRNGCYDEWNFYFGNLEPYRVVLTSEFQHEFDPPMEQLRADPYDNQMGEVEIVGGYADPRDFDGTAETLSVELWVD